MPIIQTENGYIYKKSTKSPRKKRALFFLILLLANILVVGGIFFAFTKFDFTQVLGMNRYVVFEGSTYYAVSLKSGESAKELSTEAESVKARDGAGFVYFDGEKYNLIANAYKTFDEANTVAQKQTEYEAAVITIKFVRLVMTATLESEQISALKQALHIIDEFFDKLQNIILSFDRAELLDAEVRQKLQILKEYCQSERESFSKALASCSEKIVTYVKIFQTEIVSNISSLVLSKNLSSDMKYVLFGTLASFENLQKNVKKSS